MPLTFILQGGFGNQLLQVCAAFYAEKKLKQKINFDSTLLTLIPKKIRLRELEVQFAIKDYKLSKFNLFNLINYRYNQKEKCLVEKDLNDLILERISKQTKLISGYFHNIDYVDESFESLSEYLNIKMNQKKSLIDVQNNYVAIHFRAGDYVLDLHTRKSHGLSSLTYYQNAIELLSKYNKINNLKIVTDSPEFAKEYFSKFKYKFTIHSNANIFDDLNILANSSGLIMSNSSFSWWGGYLAERNNGAKIVYPEPWFAGNLPDPKYFFRTSWLKLNRVIEI